MMSYLSVNISLLYIFNIAVSWGLLLLIWLVQIIIYPGFERVPSTGFINYHRWYVKRISAVVLPLMICEVIISVGWLMLENYSIYSVIATLLVVIIWLSTFTLQVPVHQKLQSAKDQACIRRLVNSNWIRTIAWTFRAFIVTIAAVKNFH